MHDPLAELSDEIEARRAIHDETDKEIARILERDESGAAQEPPERKGMEVSELERRVAESRRTRPERSIKDIIEDAKPRLPSLADRIEDPEFHVASFPESGNPASTPDEPPKEPAPSTPATNWPKVLIGVFAAFLLFFLGIASAYQNAGVVSVELAHSMIAAGWILFMLSIGFADYYLPLQKRVKIKLLIFVGIASLVFAVGADRIMVRLKAQQQTERPPSPQPTPVNAERVTVPQAQPSVAQTAERIPLDIAPETLMDYFQKYNEAQAEGLIEPHIGKWIELSGKITGVRRAALVPGEGDRTLKYGIEVTFSSRRADRPKARVLHRALFDEQRWMDRAVVLQPKEDIKVRGPIKYVYFYGFYLEHCEIIE